MVIAVTDLSYRYTGTSRDVLSGITIELQPGEICVLLGPSGAGKSTLLRCMAGLLDLQVTSTTATITTLAHKKSAMVFQDHALIAHKNVLWHVCCGALSSYSSWRSLFCWRATDINRALHILDTVGLGKYTHTPIQNLSGGQQQRVAIARALMQQPTLILADEPVASLDPGTAQGILQLFREIIHDSRNTRSCFISMHNVELALSIADRVLGLRDGRIIYDGSAADCTADIQHELFTTVNEEDLCA